MIAPMEKFILVLLEKDASSAPLYLRKLGIAHVDKVEGSGEAYSTLEKRLRGAEKAFSILSSYKGEVDRASVEPKLTAGEIFEKVLEIDAGIADEQAAGAELSSEIQRIQSWGDFNPELFGSLAESGENIRLFECSAKKLKELPSDIDYLRLASPKGSAYIAVTGGAELPPGFTLFKLPSSGLAQKKRLLEESEAKLASLRGTLSSLSLERKALGKAIRDMKAELTLESLRSGMPREERLCYLTGYVPARDSKKLQAEAKKRGWAFAAGEPDDGDMPPTKIENSPIVNIIQPVFDFLGTVPHYREYDISLWFLVFFSIFFAMIFGDGGYGLILLAMAFFQAVKAKRRKLPIQAFNKLLFALGGVTTLWGLATSTWFAIPFENLPAVLRNLSIGAFNGANPDSGTNTKILCFVIGAVQLAIAHSKNIKRDFPQIKFLAQVGSLLLVVGMFNAVLNLVVDATRFPIQTWALALIGGGFLLVFVFGNWNGNLLQSLAESLKSIIPTFLGTVSVFADIVSYIRLWAVGLAGLAISQTVNGMAIQLIGPVSGRIVAFIIGAVMGLVLLVAGHGLNILMSVLSVVVHGMRLNMLEFSGHLGMEWSGYKYEPLSEMAEKDTIGVQE